MLSLAGFASRVVGFFLVGMWIAPRRSEGWATLRRFLFLTAGPSSLSRLPKRNPTPGPKTPRSRIVVGDAVSRSRVRASPSRQRPTGEESDAGDCDARREERADERQEGHRHPEGDPGESPSHPAILEEPDSGDGADDVRQDGGAAGHEERGHEVDVQDVEHEEAQEDQHDQENEGVVGDPGPTIYRGERPRKHAVPRGGVIDPRHPRGVRVDGPERHEDREEGDEHPAVGPEGVRQHRRKGVAPPPTVYAPVPTVTTAAA